MRLWVRSLVGDPVQLHFDQELQVSTQSEWLSCVSRADVLNSILWPEPPLFPLSGPNYHGRRHPHEKRYGNDPSRNASYREACRRLAERLKPLLGEKKCLVYIPLRGALPIWRCISQYLPDVRVDPYFAVTSSFVFYPREFRIRNVKGKPASGRHTNILELRSRIKPVIGEYDVLVYVDEIVSGGMMAGYLRDMFAQELDSSIAILAVGLADGFGERSEEKRAQIEQFRSRGRIQAFLWEGCECLITEDQRYLLGMHYIDYQIGPNVVPMLYNLQPSREKREFDRDVLMRSLA
jgi:hypothetical protein